MPGPIVETLEDLGDRHFSFYPAILNIEHNEWTLGQMNWSEVSVVNAKTGAEVWIPRRFVGEFSSAADPMIILGLRKELEYKAGAVWPRERQLFSLPKSRSLYTPKPSSHEGPPPPHGATRTAEGQEKQISRLIVTALAIAVTLILVVVAITMRPVSFKGVEQLAIQLNGDDDYDAVVRKVGTPTEDRWRADAGEMQYRALAYKGRPYTLILMGADRKTARYVGAMDPTWKPVHSVALRNGGDTLAMLRRLPKF
jgi:hypothetical protein